MLEKIFGSSIDDKRQSRDHTVLNNRFVLNIPAIGRIKAYINSMGLKMTELKTIFLCTSKIT